MEGVVSPWPTHPSLLAFILGTSHIDVV
jgi:hypothetical protein